MKNVLATFIEGAIVGVIMAVLLIVLGIEATTFQTVAIIVGVFLSTGIASAIKNVITKGHLLYSYEWAIQYNEHSIIVKAGNAEELYINGAIADRKTGISTKAVELKGELGSGEKVTAVISPNKLGEAATSGKSLRCELFVDGKPLQMAAS